MEAEEGASLGFSFDLRTERTAPLNALAVVKRVFEYQSFPVTPEEALAEIVKLTSAGETDRAFRRWLDERGGGYDRRYAELLFTTVCLGCLAPDHPVGVAPERGKEYWALWCLTSYCESHRALDGLVRRADDPVWTDIYPPNGWCCGCSVIIAETEDRRRAPKIRVTAKLRARCRDWLESDLEEYVNEHWR